MGWLLRARGCLDPHARAEQPPKDHTGHSAFGAMVHQIKTLAGTDDRLTIQRIAPPDAFEAFAPRGWSWVQGVAVYGSSIGQGDFSGLRPGCAQTTPWMCW